MAEPLPRFRVLLVVRDAGERSALTQFLAPDFEVKAVGSGEEALAALKDHPFEVLLIEQTLDGARGADVAAEAAKLPGVASCVLLADNAEDMSPAQRASAGLLTVVVKPWHAVRLIRLLEQSARLTLARRAADLLQKSRS